MFRAVFATLDIHVRISYTYIKKEITNNISHMNNNSEVKANEYLDKVKKWLNLSPIERFEVMRQVNSERGKAYKTETHLFAACIRKM